MSKENEGFREGVGRGREEREKEKEEEKKQEETKKMNKYTVKCLRRI